MAKKAMTMLPISTAQDEFTNWEFVTQSDVSDVDSNFDVRSFDLDDSSLHSSFSASPDHPSSDEEYDHDEVHVAIAVAAAVVDEDDSLHSSSSEAYAHQGVEKEENYGPINFVPLIGVLMPLPCHYDENLNRGSEYEVPAHHDVEDDHGHDHYDAPHDDVHPLPINDDAITHGVNVHHDEDEVPAHHSEDDDHDDDESDDDYCGYGIDDELVPWEVKDVYERQRIRKSGKKSLARLMKSKKPAVVRNGCVRGKYALGLKAC